MSSHVTTFVRFVSGILLIYWPLPLKCQTTLACMLCAVFISLYSTQRWMNCNAISLFDISVQGFISSRDLTSSHQKKRIAKKVHEASYESHVRLTSGGARDCYLLQSLVVSLTFWYIYLISCCNKEKVAVMYWSHAMHSFVSELSGWDFWGMRPSLMIREACLSSGR